MSLISKINKKYVTISNGVTESYEGTYGLFCDIYLPNNNPNPDNNNEYSDVNIFNPHKSAIYSETPDFTDIKYYIPNLFKKESANSSHEIFDNFYLEGERRPYIETTKSKELPKQTKVVVKVENTKFYFTIGKKLVVNGADGHMILRMTLEPLVEG